MIKLSVNETKWSSLLARTRALILYISIWIFDFGPVKLPGPSRNGPQAGKANRKVPHLLQQLYLNYACLRIECNNDCCNTCKCIHVIIETISYFLIVWVEVDENSKQSLFRFVILMKLNFQLQCLHLPVINVSETKPESFKRPFLSLVFSAVDN